MISLASFAKPSFSNVSAASRLAAGVQVARAEETEPNASKSSSAAIEDELELSTSQSSEATEEAKEAREADGLTPEEEEQVKELSDRDREVRAHEQAHLAAAGPHARGGPTYTFQTGPDGRNYAIGGEVQIDTSPVDGDPEATIQKAQIVRAAALAPAEPSAQDRRVAAAATKMEQAAAAELKAQRTDALTQDEAGSQQSTPRSPRNSAKTPDVGRFLDLIA